MQLLGEFDKDWRDRILVSELILFTARTRQCRVPTINHRRDTALPSPLSMWLARFIACIKSCTSTKSIVGGGMA
ncbi:hypothetical protein [Microcoleus anatoxicus]|uniref:Uncharacterized protein n=1 Tax=Microcoleus anatoxicus PTRS2 TaxID=2705321 RepID=A0ABU8YTY0_9CYAN